jgi:hypothetical protein
VSASLEAVAWATLTSLLVAAVSNSSATPLNGWFSRNLGIAIGYGFLVYVIAAAVSVANVIYLGKATNEIDEAVLGISKENFPITSFAVLGASVAC